MKHLKTLGLIALSLAVFGVYGKVISADVHKKAPAFTAADSEGKQHKLSDLKGKFVVLEWTNHGCPFVVSQYKKNKMQKLQAKWMKKDVVWLRVNSSAPGKEGHCSPEQCNAEVKKYKVNATATLLDEDGKLGKKYGAKTTPHMFVIDPKGILIYAGAIDNAPREDGNVSKNSSGEAFVNYVDQALSEAAEGKAVSVPATTAYGCGIKYKK